MCIRSRACRGEEGLAWVLLEAPQVLEKHEQWLSAFAQTVVVGLTSSQNELGFSSPGADWNLQCMEQPRGSSCRGEYGFSILLLDVSWILV